VGIAHHNDQCAGTLQLVGNAHPTRLINTKAVLHMQAAFFIEKIVRSRFSIQLKHSLAHHDQSAVQCAIAFLQYQKSDFLKKSDFSLKVVDQCVGTLSLVDNALPDQTPRPLDRLHLRRHHPLRPRDWALPITSKTRNTTLL
jgi:hypothetical protein